MSASNALIRKDQLALLKTLEKTSTQVRYLDSLGLARGDIKRVIDSTFRKGGKPIRYQHVRGILVTPVANPTETWES